MSEGEGKLAAYGTKGLTVVWLMLTRKLSGALKRSDAIHQHFVRATTTVLLLGTKYKTTFRTMKWKDANLSTEIFSDKYLTKSPSMNVPKTHKEMHNICCKGTEKD